MFRTLRTKYKVTPQNIIDRAKNRGGENKGKILIINSDIFDQKALVKFIELAAAQLPNIESLHLNGLNLKSLPDNLDLFPKLQYLDASNNNIERLNPSFKKLTQLKSLRLINNNFKHYPDSESLPDKLINSGKISISLEGNPLTLKSFLSIINDPKLVELFDVDQYAVYTAALFKTNAYAKLLAINIAKIYPGVTVKEFYNLLKNNKKTIEQISVSNLSYTPNSNGKYVLTLLPPVRKIHTPDLKKESVVVKTTPKKKHIIPSSTNTSPKETTLPLDKSGAQKNKKGDRRTIFPGYKYTTTTTTTTTTTDKNLLSENLSSNNLRDLDALKKPLNNSNTNLQGLNIKTQKENNSPYNKSPNNRTKQILS